MPLVTVTLDQHEEESFGEALIGACATQMLRRYSSDPEGNAVGRPSELARQIQDVIIAEIREQASAAAPDVARKVLETGVPDTDSFGYSSGRSTKTVAEVIADQVKKDLRHPSGRSGEGVLSRLIREEVSRQLRDELKTAVDEAKRVVTSAVTKEATEALQRAVASSLPSVQI